MKHGKIKKRLIFVAFLVLVFTAIFFIVSYTTEKDKREQALSSMNKKETLILWYSDDALTPYLNSKSLAFTEETDIRVETKLVSGLEYLEEINRASISDTEETPDMYIVTNDSLEKAYLSGLASELSEASVVNDETKFNQAAKNAVTYDGKLVGCPMYFETSALLYNKTYLEQIATVTNEENDTEDTEEQSTTTPIAAQDLIPASIADIVNFADMYSAPENVEYFFKWDVSDIFYNYFFIGNYISVGGDAGDDKSKINIYNPESIASLMVYQELNQFFSIDTKETNYDSIMQEFLEGKTIYTIATSDCIKKLDTAAQNGEFLYEYGVAEVPDINDELKTKGMSVTNALVINGYSRHKEAAGSFIDYLINSASSDLYSMTGKISAVTQTEYENEKLAVFMQNYANSVPMPKMIETSNFWIELEICFSKVWSGDDANMQIKSLAEKIKTQLAGEAVSERPLQDPDVELFPTVE